MKEGLAKVFKKFPKDLVVHEDACINTKVAGRPSDASLTDGGCREIGRSCGCVGYLAFAMGRAVQAQAQAQLQGQHEAIASMTESLELVRCLLRVVSQLPSTG